MSAFARKLANGESFFNQYIEATGGDGDTLLSPTLPGDIEVLEIGEKQYMLNDGAFLASSDKVELIVKTQNIGQALFGGTGGFFVTKTSGNGKLAVSGLGTTFAMDVTPENPVIIDNSHVVAWDANLDYEISLSTQKSGGFLSNVVNSITSGEGIVTKFKGRGKVYVCSRNRDAFLQWISRSIAPRR